MSSSGRYWGQGWRRVMLANGMLVYPGLTAASVPSHVHGAAAVAAYAIVGAFTACYLAVIAAVAAGRPRRGLLLAGVLGALFAAELPFLRTDAFFLAVVVVSVLAVLRREWTGPAVLTGALAALVLPWAVRPWHTGPGYFQAMAIFFNCLVVAAFAEIASTNKALVTAQAEVERLAQEAERNRIARDLHDLLGHSLTAITVKSRLAQRLVAKDTALAQAEMAAVENLSRQALADVRAAVSGYREVTLAGELARGRELLRAAGVLADLPSATDVVAERERELFGWVLREGLTNVVRHARATRCTVTITADSIEIRDDGRATGDNADGKGLTGLRERVAAAGGAVLAGPLDPHGWRVYVTTGRAPEGNQEPR
ncbi:sensor histidine kinase [Kitasatospora viridis]|uniref:Two-component system sensor histidine kinase DesK n=1 Tax=Kitasatospora viridis TaxID=281105 RepID=A0A561UBX2_9ACTN|nr:histidine kinase [Kitasatospora viridis]TWF96839.1 two-component system sensor histidine kinase DesK [Kitasatospora viridis]